MKKFMIFLVMLVPIVCIAVVQLTSNYVEKTKYVSASSIVINQTVKEIQKTTDEDIEYQLDAKVYPLTATNRGLIYSSSNEDIATVDNSGLITFKDFGFVTITATSEVSDSISASCKFHIFDTVPHRIELIKYPKSLRVGESFYIISNIIPNEAENKTISYSSSNPEIATISPDGKITALSPGVTEITLKTVNDVTRTFTLQVIMPETGIHIPAEQKYLITGSSVFDLPEVVVYPENATNKEVLYTVENPEIAEVKNGKIYFKKAGVVTIIAQTVDGGFSEDFCVEYTGGFLKIADIIPEDKSIEMDYEENKKFSLRTDIFPTDADLNNIRFESSNESVVEVVGKELVIKGGGRAVITMFANTGTSEISSVSNIFIRRKTSEIIAEDQQTNRPIMYLNYTRLPSDTTESVEFESSSSLIEVTKDGRVEFKAQGSALVKIKTPSGAYKEIVVTYLKADGKIKTITEENQKISVDYLESFSIVFDKNLNFGLPEFSGFDEKILEYNAEEKEFCAIKGGNTTIVAKDGEKEIIINVEVIRLAEDLTIESPDVDLNQEEVVTSKTQIQFSATASPDDRTNKGIVFSVSDKSVATITETGLLTFLKAGEVNVIVSADGIVKTKTIRSTFNKIESFELESFSKTLEDVGEKTIVKIKEDSVFPKDYVVEEFLYSSSNNAVCIVDSSGSVTATGKGQCKILVQVGQVACQMDIEVKLKTKAVDITYNGEVITAGSIVGKSVLLGANVYPIDANDKRVRFELEDTSLATIKDGLLTFNENCFGSVLVKVITLDSGVNKVVKITRIASPQKIDVYQMDKSILNSVLNILPSDSGDIVVRVGVSAENLLDPEVALKNILVENISDDGLELSITKADNGYITIKRTITKSKKLHSKIIFKINDLSASFEINYLNLKGLELELKNEEDINYGLEQKRVFGTKKFTTEDVSDYTTTNKFQINFSRSPSTNEDILYWFSSSPEVAYVDEEGMLIVNYEAITTEMQVTITVGDAESLEECTVTSSYTYTFVPAINVYSANDYIRAIGGSLTLVLQTSLETTEDNSGQDYVILDGWSEHYFYGDVYGNGYTINFNNYSIEVISFCGNIRNVKLKGDNNAEDGDKSSYERKLALSNETGKQVIIEYCEFKNWYRTWVAITNHSEGTTTIKNTIIKHCSQVGLQIGGENIGKVYLENTIFADVAQTAVDFQAGALYIKGFFDVYNFTKASDFDFGYESAIKAAYKDEALKKYIDSSGSEKQANIAIAIIPKYNVVSFEDRDVDTVYFWDKSINDYVANFDSTESQNGEINGTGLGYERISYTFKPTIFKEHMVYLFCAPLESSNNYINSPDILLTESGERKVYRLYSGN